MSCSEKVIKAARYRWFTGDAGEGYPTSKALNDSLLVMNSEYVNHFILHINGEADEIESDAFWRLRWDGVMRSNGSLFLLRALSENHTC